MLLFLSKNNFSNSYNNFINTSLMLFVLIGKCIDINYCF